MAKTIEELKEEQQARALKFGINAKENYGNLFKPEAMQGISDEDYADPVNYMFPVNDKANTMASSRVFDTWELKEKYSDAERQIILSKIFAAQEKFNIKPDDIIRYSEENTDTETNYIEVFKSGKHTDSAGNVKEWTETDLDTIVNSYNEQPEEERHRAPVVLGHPKDDAPAYGWVSELKRNGNKVLAKLEKVPEKFKEWVNDGLYNTVSIALYPNLLLRHLGFLGANPPAIKGLKAPEFSNHSEYQTIDIQAKEDKPNFYSFLESKQMDNEQMQKFIEWARTELGEDIATKIAGRLGGSSTEEGKGKFEESPEFLEYKAETNKKFEKQEKELSEMRFKEYFDKQVNDGQLKPAQRDIVKKSFEIVGEGENTYAFGEKKLTAKDIVKELINSFPKQIEFNEFANSGEYQEREEKRKEGLKALAEERNKKRGV